jgi:hypothetical protein
MLVNSKCAAGRAFDPGAERSTTLSETGGARSGRVVFSGYHEFKTDRRVPAFAPRERDFMRGSAIVDFCLVRRAHHGQLSGSPRAPKECFDCTFAERKATLSCAQLDRLAAGRETMFRSSFREAKGDVVLRSTRQARRGPRKNVSIVLSRSERRRCRGSAARGGSACVGSGGAPDYVCCPESGYLARHS